MIDFAGSEELPNPPMTMGLNVTHQHASDAASIDGVFDNIYHRFEDVPFYEEARKAFRSAALTSRKVISGVNTFHEQLIAGRITPDDMKTLGYTRLGKFKAVHKEILIEMTRQDDPISSKDMRTLMDMSVDAVPFKVNQRDMASDQRATALTYALYVFRNFGMDVAAQVRSYEAVAQLVHPVLNQLKREPDAGVARVRYIEEFITHALTLWDWRGYRTFYLFKNDYDSGYSGKELIMLMDNGLTPLEAAQSLVEGLSAERAKETRGMNRVIAEGVL